MNVDEIKTRVHKSGNIWVWYKMDGLKKMVAEITKDAYEDKFVVNVIFGDTVDLDIFLKTYLVLRECR